MPQRQFSCPTPLSQRRQKRGTTMWKPWRGNSGPVSSRRRIESRRCRGRDRKASRSFSSASIRLATCRSGWTARAFLRQTWRACPLWSVHQMFQTPRQIVTQWLELPDGQRFFSIARTVTAGGGAFGAPRVERAIALCCAAEHAGRLIYTEAAARRRSHTDRRHMPSLPPHQMHSAISPAYRTRDPPRRLQDLKRPVWISAD